MPAHHQIGGSNRPKHGKAELSIQRFGALIIGAHMKAVAYPIPALANEKFEKQGAYSTSAIRCCNGNARKVIAVRRYCRDLRGLALQRLYDAVCVLVIEDR